MRDALDGHPRESGLDAPEALGVVPHVTFRNENTKSTDSKTDRNLPSAVFLASMNRAMVRILRTFLLLRFLLPF